MTQLHQDFLRGVSTNVEPSMACARFAETASIAASASLQFKPEEHSGQLFLGVVDAEVRQSRRQYNRLTRYVDGGTAIGCADDRHMLTVAGSRGGKGRGRSFPI